MSTNGPVSQDEAAENVADLPIDTTTTIAEMQEEKVEETSARSTTFDFPKRASSSPSLSHRRALSLSDAEKESSSSLSLHHLHRRTSSTSLVSHEESSTLCKFSSKKSIETGKEGVRAQYAQIRTAAASKLMGDSSWKKEKVVRFFSEMPKNKLFHRSGGVNNNGGHGERDNRELGVVGEEIHSSRHGRLDVIASTKVVSVRDYVEEEDDEEMGRDDERNKGHGANKDTPHLETETLYRLTARRPVTTITGRLLAAMGISASVGGIYDSAGSDHDACRCCGIEPSFAVTRFLHWTFRQSFLAVFFVFACGFFGLTIGFALLMWWIGSRRNECIYVNGEYFSAYVGSSPFKDFGDAFTLSWTTFSTVGYGNIFPSMSAIKREQTLCAPIKFICSLESFVGLLFASFCGAIMFAKVARVRSHAQVVFSDAIVVSYGAGVSEEQNEDDDGSASVVSAVSSGSNDQQQNWRQLPCPVLEFRVANRLSSTVGGEIMDSAMNIVASIDQNRASQSLRKKKNANRRRKGKLVKRKENRSHLRNIDETDAVMDRAGDSLQSLAIQIRESAKYAQNPFEEDVSGKIIPKRVFAKIEIETPDHPFFKRIWTARHTLDLESPILLDEAKHMLRLNNGYWPSELNDYESVRACLNLDQLLVSLSGTSNADANSVYAQKIYDFHDINVGYRFVNMLYRDPKDGSLKVDHSVINDVVEQPGGGGEPFQSIESNTFGDMLVL